MDRIDTDARTAASQMVEVVRRELGLNVAFISEIEGDRRTFRALVSDVELPIEIGHSEDFEGTYCEMITSGRLDEVVPDTSVEPLTADAFHTSFLGIGAYVGVPMRRSGGQLFGTLCAFSRTAVPTLSSGHADVLRATADLIMRLIEAEEAVDDRLRELALPVGASFGSSAVTDLLPVVEVATGAVVGHDCLPRFEDGATYRRRLAEARDVGRGVELELAVLTKALASLRDSSARELAVSLSVEALRDPAFPALVAGTEPSRLQLVFDVEEPIADYEELTDLLQPWRLRGVRVAVDRLGGGGAELHHLLLLSPDLLRIHPALVRGVVDDPRHRALVEALGVLAGRIDAVPVALGVTAEAELAWLEELGITHAVRSAGGRQP